MFSCKQQMILVQNCFNKDENILFHLIESSQVGKFQSLQNQCFNTISKPRIFPSFYSCILSVSAQPPSSSQDSRQYSGHRMQSLDVQQNETAHTLFNIFLLLLRIPFSKALRRLPPQHHIIVKNVDSELYGLGLYSSSYFVLPQASTFSLSSTQFSELQKLLTKPTSQGCCWNQHSYI